VLSERKLCAEVVHSGTWLYDDQVLSEVWIVKQNFEYHYEPDFASGPEELNADGETFQVVIARDGRKIGLGPAKLSLPEAISAAEEVIQTKITWTNHIQQKLFGGRCHSVAPLPHDNSQLSDDSK
jgi:hypothetical protein